MAEVTQKRKSHCQEWSHDTEKCSPNILSGTHCEDGERAWASWDTFQILVKSNFWWPHQGRLWLLWMWMDFGEEHRWCSKLHLPKTVCRSPGKKQVYTITVSPIPHLCCCLFFFTYRESVHNVLDLRHLHLPLFILKKLDHSDDFAFLRLLDVIFLCPGSWVANIRIMGQNRPTRGFNLARDISCWLVEDPLYLKKMLIFNCSFLMFRGISLINWRIVIGHHYPVSPIGQAPLQTFAQCFEYQVNIHDSVIYEHIETIY